MSAAGAISPSTYSDQSDQTGVDCVNVSTSATDAVLTAVSARLTAENLAISQQSELFRSLNLRGLLEMSVTTALDYERILAKGDRSLKECQALNAAIQATQFHQNELITMAVKHNDTAGAYKMNGWYIPPQRRNMHESEELGCIRGLQGILNATMERIGDKLAEMESRELADIGISDFVFPFIVRNKVDFYEDDGYEADKDSDEETDDATDAESDVVSNGGFD